MARGATAKEKVVNKIKEVYGKDFVGEFDKKIYVWEDDGVEKVQIAIALTCPKNPVGVVSASDNGFDAEPVIGSTGFEPAKMTAEEDEKIESLMKKLGF